MLNLKKSREFNEYCKNKNPEVKESYLWYTRYKNLKRKLKKLLGLTERDELLEKIAKSSTTIRDIENSPEFSSNRSAYNANKRNKQKLDKEANEYKNYLDQINSLVAKLKKLNSVLKGNDDIKFCIKYLNELVKDIGENAASHYVNDFIKHRHQCLHKHEIEAYGRGEESNKRKKYLGCWLVCNGKCNNSDDETSSDKEEAKDINLEKESNTRTIHKNTCDSNCRGHCLIRNDIFLPPGIKSSKTLHIDDKRLPDDTHNEVRDNERLEEEEASEYDESDDEIHTRYTNNKFTNDEKEEEEDEASEDDESDDEIHTRSSNNKFRNDEKEEEEEEEEASEDDESDYEIQTRSSNNKFIDDEKEEEAIEDDESDYEIQTRSTNNKFIDDESSLDGTQEEVGVNASLEAEEASEDDESLRGNEANHIRICANCFRREHDLPNSHDRRYLLPWEELPRSDIVEHKIAFRRVARVRNATDSVRLCSQCYGFLSNHDHRNKHEYTWPSFVWALLSNEDVRLTHGQNMWRFIPKEWREWWLVAVQSKFPQQYKDVTIDSPAPHFHDKSYDRQTFLSDIELYDLVTLKRTINNYLLPTVLCPWGCSCYFHKCGFVDMDIVFQRYIRNCKVTILNASYEKLALVETAREDFIRNRYKKLLLNPDWPIMPSIVFVDGIDGKKVPKVLACRCHDGGTRDYYMHLPKLPYHFIPSKYPNQLAHASIKPRSVCPMQAKKYCTTYQMHRQKGCYQGIDTCDITSVKDFSKSDVVLQEFQCRSINNRNDINALLTQFHDEDIFSKNTVEGMRKMAKELEKKERNDMNKLLGGATYMPVEVAMKTQSFLVKDQRIRMCLDNVVDDNGNCLDDIELLVKRNWPRILYPCQKLDKYGAAFPPVCGFVKTPNTQLLWIMSSLLTRVQPLWTIVDSEIPGYYLSKWHGWMLYYIGAKYFSNISFKRDNRNKFCNITSHQKILEKLPIDDCQQLDKMFENIDGVLCHQVRSYDFENENNFMIDIKRHKVLVFYNTFHRGDEFPIVIEKENHQYELVTIVHFKQENGLNKWHGNIYSRHGGELKKWWCQERKDKYVYHAKEDFDVLNLDLKYQFVCFAYIKKTTEVVEELKDDFLKYLGGHPHVLCRYHKRCLITSVTKDRECLECKEKKEYISCPNLHCHVCLCKSCFKKLRLDEKTVIPQNRDEEDSISGMCICKEQ